MQVEEKQCTCGSQLSFSLFLFRLLQIDNSVNLNLKSVLRAMGICRKQEVVNFPKIPSHKSSLSVDAKKLLSPSVFILSL